MPKRIVKGHVVQIDGKPGAYGVVFPDLPGCTAMGKTFDSALANAEVALRDWTEIMNLTGHHIPTASHKFKLSTLIRLSVGKAN